MKTLLLFFTMLVIGLTANAQAFQPGNLVISRYGDGVTNLPGNQRTVPVFIDEYDLSGNKVRTLEMPVASAADNVDDDSGNRILTGGTKFKEGLITLSPNGQFLTVIGYNTAPYSTLYSPTTQRTIGIITSDGVIDTRTGVRANIGNPRCAITHNGASIWYVGSGAGLKHKVAGTIARNDSVILNPPANYNSVYIFNGQLYYTSSHAAGPKIGKVGTGLTYRENEVESATPLPGYPNTGSADQIIMLDHDTSTPEPDLMYVTDSSDGSLQKWVIQNDSWVTRGRVVMPGVTDGIAGITGDITSGRVELYAVTGTALLKFSDPDAISSAFSSATNAPAILVEAPEKTLFKGVAFAPGTVRKAPFQDVSSREFASLITQKTNLIAELKTNETFQRYPGVEETNVTYTSNRGVPVALFFLKVNLSNPNVTIEAATPYDKPAFARQTIRDMIPYKNAANDERQVVAASNGDYYSWTGEPDGVVHKNGEVIKGSPPNKFFFGVKDDGTALVGDKRIYDAEASRLKEAIGGRFYLVHYNEVMTRHLKDVSVEPRTTAGVLSPDRVVFMWVDGRRAGHSAGLSLTDMAEMYKAIGATDAINLDGGGSTTFLMREKDGSYQVRNKPSDNSERANANALMVLMKNEILKSRPRSPGVNGSAESIAVYPNPVHDVITISVEEESDNDNLDFLLLDSNGLTLLEKHGSLTAINKTLNKELKTLKGGIYVAKITSESKSYTKRFLKK